MFVAVAGASRAGEPTPADGPRRERRALQRRLRDAAFADVLSHRHLVSAALLVPLLAAGVLSSGPVFKLWLLTTALLVVGWCVAAWALHHTRRGDTRPLRRVLVAHGTACVVALGVHPWLADAGPAVALIGPLLSMAALVLVFAFAPLGSLWAAVALIPLSAGLELLAQPQTAERWTMAWHFGAAMSVAAIGLVRHRRWCATQRALMQRDERISVLQQACDEAMRADRDKSRFIAIASHDLRQPVHALALFAATLEKRLQGTSEEPLVRNVMRSIEGLERSFNAMLDVSRLDAGAVEPNIQHFPLRDLFRRLYMHYAGQAEAAGLGLRFSPGGKAVSSDPQLLERILGNLIQNAIKYTERGGAVVVARSTSTHTNLEVWDTGVGIRPAELPRIFDEFYQSGHGERSRAQGLGMGLAIVKRLAHLLGYRLAVASRSGRGTMFRLSIPLGGLPEIQDVTAAADTLPMRVMQPRSVLVIEDEAPIREGLRILLEEWGYGAIITATAHEAQEAAQALDAPPDLILSDLHLGDGPDGIAAIDAVRQQCGHEVPAILITGDTSHEQLRRASDTGHAVLFKPLQARKLFNALRGMSS